MNDAPQGRHQAGIVVKNDKDGPSHDLYEKAQAVFDKYSSQEIDLVIQAVPMGAKQTVDTGLSVK